MATHDNSEQIDNPAFRLASLDSDFLLSKEMRGVRFMLEYAKAELALERFRIRSTIIVYGSARALEGEDSRMGWLYDEARRFGRIASERGGALQAADGEHHNVIATGGGPGIMEAANRGARDAGAVTIGFNITLPHEQMPNPYTTPDLTLRFHYFAMRKMHLAMRANALVVFPGGFGTLDELFEILTLVQTGKAPGAPIVLFDEAFWRSLVNFDKLLEYGTISPRDLDLFAFANDAEEAWRVLTERGLQAREITGFTT